MKRILISGYYGFDNAGDEAVLAGLITGLRSGGSLGGVEISALSIDPVSTTRAHGIPAYHRYKQLLPAIQSSDLLLSGGGSLLQDVTSAHGIFYYLAVVRMAQILGKKTMFVAQGIGPLTRARSRKLTASVANRLDAITVRDQQSSDLLASIGVALPVTVSADPALLLTSPKPPTKSGVLLSVREWPGLSGNFSENLAAAIVDAGLPTPILPLDMYGASDSSASQAVLSKIPGAVSEVSESTDFWSLLRKIAGSEMVVGMRLHSLIFAVASGVPVAALSYDPKVDAFMKQIGQEDAVVPVQNATKEQLNVALKKVWASRRERAESLQAQLPRLRNLAQSNADIALSLLE